MAACKSYGPFPHSLVIRIDLWEQRGVLHTEFKSPHVFDFCLLIPSFNSDVSSALSHDMPASVGCLYTGWVVDVPL